MRAMGLFRAAWNAGAPVLKAVGEHLAGLIELVVVAQARRAPCALTCFGKDRKDQRRKNGYYRDHDEQLNERESAIPGRSSDSSHLPPCTTTLKFASTDHSAASLAPTVG